MLRGCALTPALPGQPGSRSSPRPPGRRQGRNALAHHGDRLQWVDADLREPDWTSQLPVSEADAAVSTTALHWLDPGVLLRLYRRLGELIRTGGVVLNGDGMPYDLSQPTCARLSAAATERATHDAFRVRGVPDWDAWWASIETIGQLADAREERQRRQAAALQRYGPRDGTRLTSLSTHLLGLSEAGFSDAGTIWQVFDDQVLLAVHNIAG